MKSLSFSVHNIQTRLKCICVALVLLTTSGLGFSQVIKTLGDITPQPNPQLSSSPSGFTEMNGILYFTGNSFEGNQLWRTDGTSDGTYLITDRDVLPFGGVLILGTYKNRLYFRGYSEGYGYELWSSDGTKAGTSMAVDINPGVNSSYMSSMIVYNDYMYFSAINGIHGTELCQSDGTPAGTKMFDLITGTGSSNPNEFIEFNGELYFAAGDEALNSARELWKYNSKDSKPIQVKDVHPIGNAQVTQFTIHQNSLYFTAQDGRGYDSELWKTDGTEAGTVRVKEITPESFNGGGRPYILGTNGNFLYMSVIHQDYGLELWKSDGTETGTQLVKDLNPGTANGMLNTGGVALNNEIFFVGNDGSTGYELFKTDGTELGTVLVKDILANSVSGSGAQGPFIVYNNAMYFLGMNESNNAEMWVSDGTTEGTKMVKEINESFSAYPQIRTIYKDKMILTATDGIHGQELWVSDGTSEGTVLLKDIFERTENTNPSKFTLVGDTLYFIANIGNIQYLYKSDGKSVEQTTQVFDSIETHGLLRPNHLIEFDDELFFTGFNENLGTELWKTKGSHSTTELVKDIDIGPANSNIEFLTKMNGSLYFKARNSITSQDALYKTDGTETTTVQVKSLWGEAESSFMRNMVAIDNKLVYFLETVENGREIYTSDGTTSGSKLLLDICPGSCSGVQSTSTMLMHNNVLYFSGYTLDHSVELWRTDGTVEGTFMIKDINPGQSVSSPLLIGPLNDDVYFVTDDGIHGRELWKTNGSRNNAELVKDINIGTGSSNISNGASNGNYLLFNAISGKTGSELWRTDGTEFGTVLVKDIYPGYQGSNPQNITKFNNTIYFTTSDPDYGLELWRTKGKEENTHIVEDLFPGTFSSNPIGLTPIHNRMYFSAEHPDYGREVFFIEDSTYTFPESTEQVINLYPNPVQDYLHIDLPIDVGQNLTIRVIDVLGKTVSNTAQPSQSKDHDLSHLVSGIYFVTVGGIKTFKIVKL